MINKRVSIYDLAATLGISSGTVSRVFNNHPEVSARTRDRVLAKAAELGYRPNPLARGLARNVVSAIGLVIPTTYDPFFLDFAQGVQEAATESSISVMMSFTDHRRGTVLSAVESFLQFRVAGILILGGTADHDTHLAQLTKEVPVLVALRRSPKRVFPAVFVDHQRGAEEMTGYLAAKTQGRIAFVSLPLHTQAALERLAGFRAALAAVGRSEDALEFVAPGNGFQDGERSIQELLSDSERRNIDAVFFASDALAIGGLSALNRAGVSVPDEMRVAGFGDITASAVSIPALTTVHVPMREIGGQAFRSLVARIVGGPAPDSDLALDLSLTIRVSA